MLQHYYPNHTWDFNAKLYPSRVQGVLFKTLSELFPGADIHLSYPHPGMRFSGRKALYQILCSF